MIRLKQRKLLLFIILVGCIWLYLEEKDENEKEVDEIKLYNLPREFMKKYSEKVQESDRKIPKIKDLHINKTYWQTTQVSPTNNMHLLSSFYDDRNKKEQPIVRVLLLTDKIVPKKEEISAFNCQFWFLDKSEPVISRISVVLENTYTPPWRHHGYMIGCHLDRNSSVPEAVSLVRSPWDNPTNLMIVEHKLPAQGETKKNRFAICSAPFYYQDVDKSAWLVEWLELNFALGAEKVHIYAYGLHPNMVKVAEHYQKLEKLEVRKMTVPGNEPGNTYQMQNQLILLNDCFNRNANLYEYIAMMDLDEILTPTKLSTWQDLMNTLPPGFAGYGFPNFNFLQSMQPKTEMNNGLPTFIFTRQNVFRSHNPWPGGAGRKFFQSTDQVVFAGVHNPIICMDNKTCKFTKVDPQAGHKHHYRNAGKFFTDMDKDTEEDTCLLSIMETLISNVTITLQTLGFI